MSAGIRRNYIPCTVYHRTVAVAAADVPHAALQSVRESNLIEIDGVNRPDSYQTRWRVVDARGVAILLRVPQELGDCLQALHVPFADGNRDDDFIPVRYSNTISVEEGEIETSELGRYQSYRYCPRCIPGSLICTLKWILPSTECTQGESSLPVQQNHALNRRWFSIPLGLGSELTPRHKSQQLAGMFRRWMV